jgi:hypothetical protein
MAKEDGDVDGFIPAAALRAARKATKVLAGKEVVTVFAKGASTKFDRPEVAKVGKFPDVSKVLVKPQKACVAFNAKYLAAAARRRSRTGMGTRRTSSTSSRPTRSTPTRAAGTSDIPPRTGT